MEQRIARLEDWRIGVESTLNEMKGDIRTIRETMQRMEVAMAKSPVCSAPNLCIELKKGIDAQIEEITKVEQEVKAVEEVVATARGGMRVVVIAIGIASAALGTLLTLFVNHIAKKGP